MVEVLSENPEQDAARLLRGFMRTAYRRPVREVDEQRFLGLFQKEFAQGSGFARSMLVAYTGVLASPGFVFVDELPGRLNDMALATRLALFLWNSTPDAALRARAEVVTVKRGLARVSLTRTPVVSTPWSASQLR